MDESPQNRCILKEQPNEMLHLFYDYYDDVNSKLSLKMCSKEFRDKTPGTVRELYRDLSRIVDFGNARFERLCLDDTYTGLKTNRHVCSVCCCLHEAEEFTAQQLEQNPRTRVCEASQRILPLMPGQGLTYQQLLNCRNVSLPMTPIHDGFFTFSPVENEDGQWTINLFWSFTIQPTESTWIKDKLRFLLEKFTVYACSHVVSSEPPEDLRAVPSRREREKPACTLCSICNIYVGFTVEAEEDDCEADSDESIPVLLEAERVIGRLGVSAIDSEWKARSIPGQ